MRNSLKATTFRLAIFAGVVGILSGCASTGGAPVKVSEASLAKTLDIAARDSENQHDYTSAAQYYARLSHEKPDDIRLRIDLARNLRYIGEAKQGVKILLEKRPSQSSNLPFLLELAKSRIAAGDAEGALGDLKALFAAAPATWPGMWDAFMVRGIARDQVQHYKLAQADYNAALKLSPKNPQVMNNYAMSLAQSGRLDAAIAILENASNQNRSNVQVRQNLALLYGVKGELGKAKALSEMDLDPKNVDTNMSFYQRFKHRGTP
ncbi:tetratricopeptide repeat protein [Varunaivibrio sulfuroxidans]|uniref:Flp pilus assembly protein TadD n=1 Tax=Varunaivibrio sulfuroxidans TaxID=1773489 RepID=A0A4V2UP73_9PROT|nr:tetratricopeptide repeat protein [Varunaivibrio sulfuroxidans]TCS64021.1 Flp pilus assembly protein TadD [Varunaivibrio sulfuroxidans]WES31526.1 tetratricopeptide repeat protein [Varunaivibrio sulfuroxidans]